MVAWINGTRAYGGNTSQSVCRPHRVGELLDTYVREIDSKNQKVRSINVKYLNIFIGFSITWKYRYPARFRQSLQLYFFRCFIRTHSYTVSSILNTEWFKPYIPPRKSFHLTPNNTYRRLHLHCSAGKLMVLTVDIYYGSFSCDSRNQFKWVCRRRNYYGVFQEWKHSVTWRR